MSKEYGLQLQLPENSIRPTLPEKLINPNYLPTLAEINQFLNINQPFPTQKDRISAVTRRDILSTIHNDYEFWTVEYIEELGKYLEKQIRDIHAKKEKVVTILEVGAGNGRFSNFLKTRTLSSMLNIWRVIAIDNVSWNIQPKFPVEKLDYQTALRKYSPDIVLCSYMPRSEDWTTSFRQQPSVEEYIIIGDTDCCGNDDTYGLGKEGKLNFKNGDFEIINTFGYTPPHEQDGFVRTNLYLSRLNHCRDDNNFIPDRSRTLSFTRKG